MNTLPPDRSKILTEQRNPNSQNLHKLSVAELVNLIHNEDIAAFDAIEMAMEAISMFIERIEQNFLAGGRLIYIGAGTSGRLGVLDASECPPTFQLPEGKVIGVIAGGDRSLRKSSEGREDEIRGSELQLRELNLKANDTILGIASGGTTPYVLGALNISKEISPSITTALLVCTPIEKPASCDYVILLETGAEVLTGSTRMKAGTATKMALNIISTTLMVRMGKVYQNLMVDLRASNDKLKDRAIRILCTLLKIERNEAADLLEITNGEVKTAVVMRKHSVNVNQAREMLLKVDSRLDKLLENE